MKKKDKIASLVDQWLFLDAQARQSGLPAAEIDAVTAHLINSLPPAVRVIVIERFRA
jgi:hypothetical protein